MRGGMKCGARDTGTGACRGPGLLRPLGRFCRMCVERVDQTMQSVAISIPQV